MRDSACHAHPPHLRGSRRVPPCGRAAYEDYAERHWHRLGRNVALLVGGADGLDPRCLGRADQRWALSPLTLPHALVRVILAEQIYRAESLLDGHPYHRD